MRSGQSPFVALEVHGGHCSFVRVFQEGCHFGLHVVFDCTEVVIFELVLEEVEDGVVSYDVLSVDITNEEVHGLLAVRFIGLLSLVLAGLEGVAQTLEVVLAVAAFLVHHALGLDVDAFGVDAHHGVHVDV